MTSTQKDKIDALMRKYNDILMVSMRLAIAEDFVGLVLVNKDDTDFELSELLKNKEEFSNHIMKEFLKKNSSSIVEELKLMKDPMPNFKKRFIKN